MGALTRIVVPLAQRLLATQGLEIRRLAKEQMAADAVLDVLSLCVADMMARLPEGHEVFCVEVGANDGDMADPIRPFIEAHGWRGVLVEPQPRVFERLVRNYAHQPQLRFENAALAPQDGSATLYCFADAPDLPADASMLASFRRDVLETNSRAYAGPIEAITVPTLTFDTLMRKHGATHMDVLQVDTEGFDWQVIKMVDFDRFRPAIIHFENNFLSAAEMADCVALLARNGYRMLNAGVDTIAYRQGVDERFVSRARGSRLNTML